MNNCQATHFRIARKSRLEYMLLVCSIRSPFALALDRYVDWFTYIMHTSILIQLGICDTSHLGRDNDNLFASWHSKRTSDAFPWRVYAVSMQYEMNCF